MQRFIHHEHIARYRQLIAEAESNPSRDEARYKVLLGPAPGGYRILLERVTIVLSSAIAEAVRRRRVPATSKRAR